jgi:hypothetical protein
MWKVQSHAVDLRIDGDWRATGRHLDDAVVTGVANEDVARGLHGHGKSLPYRDAICAPCESGHSRLDTEEAAGRNPVVPGLRDIPVQCRIAVR